jgi:hypothetical protein
MTATLTWACLPADCANAAVETYAVRRPYRGRGRYGDFDIDMLFRGALIFLALFLSCFLAWKGIEWLRKRRRVDDAAAKGGHHKDPEDPWVHSISTALAGHDGAALGQPPPITGAAMNQREQEEIFSAARKARKEMQRRRTARQQAQKTQSDS